MSIFFRIFMELTPNSQFVIHIHDEETTIFLYVLHFPFVSHDGVQPFCLGPAKTIIVTG